MRKDFREALREVRKWKPVRDIFPSAGQRIEVMVTGKELFSEINSRVPSPDVIDYLREISSNLPRMSEMTIVVDEEVDFDRVVRTYRSYIAFSLKRSISELRSLTVKILSFLGVGAALLVTSYFLEGLTSRVVYDAVNIIGGFSVWEAADTFVFARAEKRRDVISALRLYHAEWKTRDIS